MNSPKPECLAAIKLLLHEHQESIAFYKPDGGGLVLVVDDEETEEALINFLRALDSIEIEGAELELAAAVLGNHREIPEA